MEQIIQQFTVTPYPGFTCQPLTEQILHRINGLSYHENDYISPQELRYLRIPYINFHQETKLGEMICNYRIAPDLLEIFHILYEQQYPIERIQLADDFQADDDLCCLKNNTSCFNYRTIAGTDTLSRHAFGLAVDINPFYNPYVTFIDNPPKNNAYHPTDGAEVPADNVQSIYVPEDNVRIQGDSARITKSIINSLKTTENSEKASKNTAALTDIRNNGITIRISPPGSEEYADRSKDFPHKLGPGDLCYEQFISHGFSWGGNWTHCKDYQHFEYNI